jgi:multimeric flavodoxin WrbA
LRLRIVGISASPRRANTEILVKTALEAAKINAEVETVYVSLANKKISGCINCGACLSKGKCIIDDDWAETFDALINPIPNGVILGAPVYFFNLNSQARAFMERATSLIKGWFYKEAVSQPPDWSRTVAGAIAVGADRHGGQEHAISSILHWLLINNFVCVGGSHVGYIGAPAWLSGNRGRDGVTKDTDIGMEAARIVGERVATTALLLAAGQEASKVDSM